LTVEIVALLGNFFGKKELMGNFPKEPKHRMTVQIVPRMNPFDNNNKDLELSPKPK